MILILLGYTQKDFAIKSETTQSYISNMINGNRPLSKKVMHYISVYHPEVNLKWMLDGEGYMLRDGYVKALESEAPYDKQKRIPVFEAAEVKMHEYEARIALLEQKVSELESMIEKLVHGT